MLLAARYCVAGKSSKVTLRKVFLDAVTNVVKGKSGTVANKLDKLLRVRLRPIDFRNSVLK